MREKEKNWREREREREAGRLMGGFLFNNAERKVEKLDMIKPIRIFD